MPDLHRLIEKERTLAVTVAADGQEAFLAELSAESVRRRTGLPTRILRVPDDSAENSADAQRFKCRLFELLPGAERILYFDCDTVFLQEWDPTPLFEGPGLVAGRDRGILPQVKREAALAGVAPEDYFHSGLMLLTRSRDRGFLAEAERCLTELPGAELPHTVFNRARMALSLPLRWFPAGFFSPDLEEAGDASRPPVVGKLRRNDGLCERALEKRFREWLETGYARRSGTIRIRPQRRFRLAQRNGSPAETEETRRRLRLEACVSAAEPYPADRFSGRGVVICGGGSKYFPCVWVCLRNLRNLGCNLPVEVWHLGGDEMTQSMRMLLESQGARTVDALQVRETYPARRLAGWELKPYAIIHSAFRQVLLLDADNVAVRNPEYLFETREFGETGAVFWPDYGRLAANRSIWRITGVSYCDEPEFESGQILLDKSRVWNELRVTMHLNEWSDYYYRHIHGDKETFHLAWRKLGTPYSMPERGIHSLDFTMCQHDFSGTRVFQHRNMAKWRFGGGNPRIPGFEREEECLCYLRELRDRWEAGDGIGRWTQDGKSAEERAAAAILCSKSWIYLRVGHDQRVMTFLNNGTVEEGAAENEVFWDVKQMGQGIRVEAFSAWRLTFSAALKGEVWEGVWEVFEKMPVVLKPEFASPGRIRRWQGCEEPKEPVV